MSGIPGCFGKGNCSALPKFIGIITWRSFDFSLLAFARRVLVHFIPPAFSLFSPFSSYWISMVVEIHTSLREIKHAENCDKAIYYLKVVSSTMHAYFFKICIKNVLFSWVCAPHIFAIYNTVLPGCLLSVFSVSSTWIKYLSPPPKY